MIKRRKTKTIRVGSVKIGQGHPISIQSMTKTDTFDVYATIRQIKALENAGCEIIRVAVKDLASARVLDKIRTKINIPLIADIHFNYRLGLQAIACGVDALRLNPGNIYRGEELRQITQAARKAKIPIRVGVNAGSLRPLVVSQQSLEKKYKKGNIADLMVRSALGYIKMLEKLDFYDIIVSLKASDVSQTVNAYRKMAEVCNYPFHLGITACGLPEDGSIKSAIGIGSLLLEGIGDTIRVSLTASPLEEVRVAKNILQALRLGNFGVEIIACPTCGRTQVDVAKITREVEKKLLSTRYSLLATSRRLKVAIMGCEVNGPGEAKDADIGVACGKNNAAIFKKGKIIRRIKDTQIAGALIQELSIEDGCVK